MLIDTCIFNGELKMLELRLKYLYDTVDLFIVAEGNQTFSGKKRQLLSGIEKEAFRFAFPKLWWTSAVLSGNDPWEREASLRNALRTYVDAVADDPYDRVMLSDVDEIPSWNAIARSRNKTLPVALTQDFFYYNMLNRRKEDWHGTIISYAQDFVTRTPQALRDKRNTLPSLPGGGWHFSYFGDANYISDKLASFSHQEYNKPPYNTQEHILNHTKSGEDLFDRGTAIEKVTANHFPPELRAIAEELRWL